METTPAFAGLDCTACGESFDPGVATGRCPACGGILTPAYDFDAVELRMGDPAARTGHSGLDADGIGRYADLLPFPADRIVSLGEGATPLVECPRLADELGVGAVHVKDEGHNPTGSVADRGAALAVTAAAEVGASDVALPTTGAGGQAVAAYAARAGIDSHAFVPSRAAFLAKAMINVHGGDMEVVGGRYGDAAEAYADAMAEEGYHGLAPFETPFRHEGAKTLAYEIVAALDAPPDAVVVPVGHGTTLFGTYAGLRDLRELGHVEELSPIYAAQAAGCAPVVGAWTAGRDAPDPVEHPDTICGGIEVPDPAGGSLVLDALAASDGGAVASPDDDVLESAVTVAATEGIEVGTAGGAAASAAWTLAADDELGDDDVVVLVNPAAGGREDDVLRSHLMGQGI